jgi:hypothetical protein
MVRKLPFTAPPVMSRGPVRVLVLLLLVYTGFASLAIAQNGVQGSIANPHGPLSIACENCHTTTAWKPIRKQPEFNHNTQTSFALLGLHQNVACTGCHVNLVFSKAPTRCADCHADLHRRQFGPNCQDCHSVRGWNVDISAIKDHNNRFPLIGAHAAVTCEDCHKGAAAGVYIGLSTQCVSCHLKDYQTGTPLNHVAANLPTTCETCHQVTVWENAKFNHNQFTSFALTGAHATLACTQCHVGNRFAGTPTDCYGCHINDFQTANNPNHVAGGFATNCTLCHTTVSWQGATFDHSTTGFALSGGHASLQCQQCHNAQFGNYSIASGACWNCHQSDYNGTTAPPHLSANFPQDCSQCHTTTPGWGGATFNHTTTGFTLTGAHTSVQCTQCHNTQFGNYSIPNAGCAQCHMADYNGATNPNHAQAGFPTTCDTCHTTVAGWGGATFNHTTTGFTLTGAHTSLQCQQCHNSQFGNYSIQNGGCGQCHMADYNGTTNPNHAQAGFPTTCDTCHTTVAGWSGATFNHTSTGFTLTGGHTSLQCQQCHNSQFGNYSIQNGACAQCHMADFNGTNNPSHVQAGFPTTCDTCHTTAAGWVGASFSHSSTGFTLTGTHTSLQCQQCHNAQFGNYSIPNGACWNCHQNDFKTATNPNHLAANFPQDCSQCHTTTNWTGATFNHSATGFTLTGAHTTLQCAQCHTAQFGNYTISSGACGQCHMTDFNGTTNPNHVQAGFPTTCDTCHTTVAGWGGATFNHSTTGFALTGTHTSLQCLQCHNSQFGNYAISSGACWNCHQTDYNGTTNPPHRATNFPQDCSGCHTTTNWLGAVFNHTTTGFALVGVHATQQCAACHVNNNYSLSSGACIGCHLADFNGATNPPHSSSGFPQDCTICHGSSITNWTSATFNHTTTGFTLTGAHTSLQCSQCHNSQFGNYAIASAACWNCHQTDYNGTTNPPHKATNFPQDCSGCHTTANWLGATFNHSTTGFTLVGVHATQQCAACHVNNNYTLNNTACIACHLADFNGATNPPHSSTGFPQDCTICHGTSITNWTSATFNHTTTGFALTGAHTTLQCSQCHNTQFGNYSIASGACWNCHQADYNGTTNPSHVAANFPHTCDSCHTTVAGWGGASFNHATTGFTLTGAHTTLQCSQCHNAQFGNYSIASGACWNCHQTDYNGTTSPPHVAANFPQDCSQCHTTVAGWGGATFNHATQENWALTGAHSTLACTACHNATFGNYSITSTACALCHMADYNGTNAPNHAQAGFPTTCDSCHTTNATTPPWAGATFTHPSTPLALTGYHATMLASSQCTACHNTIGYTSSATQALCITCHQADYNGTTNPPHAAQGFPTTCDSCHTFVDWTGAVFNHASTGFTLTGAHTTLACTSCHNATNGNYNLTAAQTACWTCHQADYNGTTNPPHATAGFPQDCSQCHSTNVTSPPWAGATFTHPSTPLALTGYHATMLTNNQCNLCHVGSGAAAYTNTPSDCWSCHQTDYNNTTNPGHAAIGPTYFPHTCNTCHTFTDWSGAQFTAHDTMSPGFPIYSGNHNGKWQNCTDCHPSSTDYSTGTLSCMTGSCHPASQVDNVGDHQSYISKYGLTVFHQGSSCYQCHPRGSGG